MDDLVLLVIFIAGYVFLWTRATRTEEGRLAAENSKVNQLDSHFYVTTPEGIVENHQIVIWRIERWNVYMLVWIVVFTIGGLFVTDAPFYFLLAPILLVLLELLRMMINTSQSIVIDPHENIVKLRGQRIDFDNVQRADAHRYKWGYELRLLLYEGDPVILESVTHTPGSDAKLLFNARERANTRRGQFIRRQTHAIANQINDVLRRRA